LKIKLKGCCFDTIEVIGAESQAVLNALTEHNFQDAFKNGRSTGNGALWKGTTLRVMVASRPEVSFLPDGSTSPRNYGYQWHFEYFQKDCYMKLQEIFRLVFFWFRIGINVRLL
jgi:hypothetical protein